VKVASNKKTLTQLQEGKNYYIKVRAYKTDSTGKKIYGAYSKVKKMVVK
jgi:endo-1,4-beta-xylanase